MFVWPFLWHTSGVNPEALRRIVDSRLADVHTCAVGIVQSYRALDHTADVLPANQTPVKSVDGVVYELPPVLPSVPIISMGTAREYNKIELQKGDLVLLLYCETSPAEVLTHGSEAQPNDLTRHGMSGALALPITKPLDLPPVTPRVALGGTVDFVALAGLVATNLQALVTALSTATVDSKPLVMTPPVFVPMGAAEVMAR
jgi:hypothetical protein